MTLFGLIERSLTQRRLSSFLTATSVALGVALVVAILLAKEELQNTYLGQSRGYSLVVGPKGSPLQIVLNSIYHVDQSPGLIPYGLYRELSGEKWRRFVRLAVPYAVGDSFRGYRVVATTPAVFDPRFPYPTAESTADKFAAGRPFGLHEEDLEYAVRNVGEPALPHDHAHEGEHAHDHSHDHSIREAVLGSEVARRLGLSLGDHIEPTHGVEGEHDHEHHQTWEVVGILKETRTAIDRVVFINLDSFYHIADHAGGVIPGTGEAGLSAIVLFPRGGAMKALLLGTLRKRGDLQVAEVAREVRALLSIVGNVDMIFLVVAVLVVVIGVVSILVAIYNTMNERRREIAILRAIGARRSTVVLAIVGEGAALAALGGLAGLLLAHGLVLATANHVESISGLRLDGLRMIPEEIFVWLIVTVTGAIAGLIPAWKAYRTDVARNLAPLS